jgi:GH24 family phage-related lysozyme (muramidase)
MMNKYQRSRASVYVRWRVYTTFATGILIGLFYSVIASDRFGTYLAELDRSSPFFRFIDHRILVLAFSGILGGLIYSIVVDGYIELPRFVDTKRDGINREDGFKAGLFGDFLLGLAGAFVLDFLTSPIGLDASDRAEILKNTPVITTAAKGIIGGYGGKAILVFALEKIFKNVDRLEEEKARYAEESFKSKLDNIETAQLLDQLNAQIKAGLPEAELIKLQQDIRSASSKIKQQVFAMAEDARSAGNFSDVTRPRIARTIPVFEALRESDSQNPEYAAQLGYAYKDSSSPNYLKALDYLNQAIDLRGDQVEGKAWRYELNRAILLIQREQQKTHSFQLKGDEQEQVVRDLLLVTRYYSLPSIIEDAKRKQIPMPVVDWATNNKAVLQQRSDTKDIVIQIEKQIRVTTDQDSKDTEVTSTQTVMKKHDNGSSTTTVTSSKTTSTTPITPAPTVVPVATTNSIPQAAIALIKKHEGFVPDAYPDPKDGWSLPTIGYGTTVYLDGRKVQRGQSVTREEAETYLVAYIEKRCRPALMKIPTWNQMNENQQSALYSFAYNLGEHFYRGEDFDSISLVCDSPSRWDDHQWITAQFEKYRNPGKNVEEGLRRRRLEEAELFCKPVSTKPMPTPMPTNGHSKAVSVEPSASITSGKGGTATLVRASAPALQKVVQQNSRLTVDSIANDQSLATEIQLALIQLELLDAPADGKFGPISKSALFDDFQTMLLPKTPDLSSEKGVLGARTAELLVNADPVAFRPELKFSNDLASRIIQYMKARKYYVFTGEQKYNIVYVEGMNPDGQLNSDAPNQFNDVRMVIECKDGVPKIVGCWEGTTEPGNHYTFNAMNPLGAARIKFGQYKAWTVGEHGGQTSSHEALVQDAPITVYRDLNRDMSRIGDREDTGVFWINQHSGFNLSRDNIDTASAGCLVGRTVAGHEEFMRIVKQDKRYRKNRGYFFYTTVIPGDQLNKEFPPSS